MQRLWRRGAASALPLHHPTAFEALVLFVLASVLGVAGLCGQQRPPQVRVLYISAFAADSSDTTTVVEALKRELTAQGLRPEVYVEALDTSRLRSTQESEALLGELLDKRYAGLRFSVLLAQASDALLAATRYRQRLNYLPPVYAFDWIDDALVQRFSRVEGFYGRPLAMGFPATLNLALSLFPQTKRVYLLASPIEQNHLAMFQQDLAQAQKAHPEVEFVPLVNQDFDEVRQTLEASPRKALGILLPGEWLLASGEFLTASVARERLAEGAPMPYFGITGGSFGSGLVGGTFPNRERMGIEAAQMIRAILGRDQALVPWQSSSALVPTVDYRSLVHFAVAPQRVPPGTDVLFAPPEFWVRYETPLKITGALLAFLVLALLVLTVVRWRERRVLVGMNASLERAVAARTRELSLTNDELTTANEILQKTMHDLRAAEGRLVVSEKLAALGRLTANISHELNSPLAAISSASGSISEYLGRGLGGVFADPLSLDEETSHFFRDVLDRSTWVGSPLSWVTPKAERAARTKAEAILREAGVQDAYPVAEELVELGIADFASRAAPFFVREGADIFLAILRATLGALRATAIVETSVAKASRIVASLGTYAMSTEDAPQNAVPVVEAMHEVLSLFSARSILNVEIRNDGEQRLLVRARHDDLVAIVFNLVKNAIQSTQGAGTIRLWAEPAGTMVRISVADTGPGIPPELKQHIFEPFFTTRPLGEGAGVGLDVSRRLARRNGGELVFSSEPGHTVFTLELPRTDASHQEAPDGT